MQITAPSSLPLSEYSSHVMQTETTTLGSTLSPIAQPFCPRSKPFLEEARVGNKRPVIDIEGSRYRVTSKVTVLQRFAAQKLRFETLRREMGAASSMIPLDMDSFDLIADCLIILHKETNRVVGTYRLINSRRTKNFYSASEFELTEFLALPGAKLELSRACIAPEHRSGMALSMLWKGIYEYARQADIRFLFGCTSIFAPIDADLTTLQDKIEEMNGFTDKCIVGPLPQFSSCGGDSLLKDDEIPTLMRGYLRAGAKLMRRPAYDRKFRCFDFFTVLDFRELSTRLSSRYERN